MHTADGVYHKSISVYNLHEIPLLKHILIKCNWLGFFCDGRRETGNGTGGDGFIYSFIYLFLFIYSFCFYDDDFDEDKDNGDKDNN